MGKDIHIVLERKTNNGWEFFDPGFEAYDSRFSSSVRSVSFMRVPP